MKKFCNLLSISRLGLAVCLLQDSLRYRLCIILGAMISDFLDGYLARRYQVTSRLGALLDPITDKVFVIVSLFVFYFEGSLSSVQLVALMSRDICWAFFAVYLSFVRGWRGYDYRSLLFGKIFTAIQFFILLGIVLGVKLSNLTFASLWGLAFLAFIERFLDYRRSELQQDL